MADRRVRQTGKIDGDISALCNRGELWSPRTKTQAVNDIRTGTHSYYVDETGSRTEVHVTPDGDLRTDPDPVSGNNLDNLADCSSREGPSKAWIGLVDSRRYESEHENNR